MRVAVIGAGVVGLAIGRALARNGDDVVVVEKNPGIGQELSSRSSEVIHAGVYYPDTSLKARLCVRGRALLLDFARRHDVPHSVCGKLIVATDDAELPALDEILKKSRKNGVQAPLQRWDGATIRRRFDKVSAVAGLWSPGTGIVDSHVLMQRLASDLQRQGGHVILGTAVTRLSDSGGRWTLRMRSAGTVEDHRFDAVVNAAGHAAKSIADLALVTAPDTLALKGSYFRITGPAPANALIYPVPPRTLAGLGVHLTIDLRGTAKLGPDVQVARSSKDVAVDPSRRRLFWESARRFLPDLSEDQLQPAFAAVRPKLAVDRFADFHITVAAPGFVQLSGIESPGLTASLAIGEYVTRLLAVR